MQCLSALLACELDLELRDYAGDTAKSVAETYNHPECLEVIREHFRKQRAKSKSPQHSGSLGDSSVRTKSMDGGRSSDAGTSATGASTDAAKNSNEAHELHHVLFANPDVPS